MCFFVTQACAEFAAKTITRVHNRVRFIDLAVNLDGGLNCGCAMIAVKLLGNMIGYIIGTLKVWVEERCIFVFRLTYVAMIGCAMRKF